MFDDKDKRMDRTVRRSPLCYSEQHEDRKMQSVCDQQNLNNTFITRGFHIIVRDWDGNIINDEYGMKGPFPDSPLDDKKILWYRPHDYIRDDYIFGEELYPTFVMPREPLFKIQNYKEKTGVYFMRIKKSNFLPRCLRETQVNKQFLAHTIARCPYSDHEPVADDFYNILGIEKNKNYFFEFQNVW